MFLEQTLQSVNSCFQEYTDWSEKSFLNRYLSVPIGNSTMLRAAVTVLSNSPSLVHVHYMNWLYPQAKTWTGHSDQLLVLRICQHVSLIYK